MQKALQSWPGLEQVEANKLLLMPRLLNESTDQKTVKEAFDCAVTWSPGICRISLESGLIPKKTFCECAPEWIRRSTCYRDRSESMLDFVMALLRAHDLCNVLDAPDKYGWTALHYVAGRLNPRGVSILIDAGLSVNVADKKGLTPLHVATHALQHPTLWHNSQRCRWKVPKFGIFRRLSIFRLRLRYRSMKNKAQEQEDVDDDASSCDSVDTMDARAFDVSIHQKEYCDVVTKLLEAGADPTLLDCTKSLAFFATVYGSDVESTFHLVREAAHRGLFERRFPAKKPAKRRGDMF